MWLYSDWLMWHLPWVTRKSCSAAGRNQDSRKHGGLSKEHFTKKHASSRTKTVFAATEAILFEGDSSGNVTMHHEWHDASCHWAPMQHHEPLPWWSMVKIHMASSAFMVNHEHSSRTCVLNARVKTHKSVPTDIVRAHPQITFQWVHKSSYATRKK